VRSTAAAGAAESRETVYVFNVGSKDVTLIDVANRQVRETRPLGASVRWLSNEQTYWDGARIWTYDFPNDQLQAIAIDPRQVAVTKTIAGLGKGPGHSLVVLPDKKKAAVNVAGDNLIAFLDLEHGSVDSTLQTGAFPWDLHLTPDGRFGFTPEREADTVSKIDMASRRLVKTVSFPARSKPHMLRVSPDGNEVWVQTADANTNVVLAASDLAVLSTEPTGKQPVTNAWTRDRRYAVVTNGQDTFAQIFDARTFKEVKRLTIGQGGSNIGFSRDGKTAFIAVRGANDVAVIDIEKLALASRIRAGTEPQGLIVRWSPVKRGRGSQVLTAALQRQSRTIPIVFAQVSDPVGSGLVASLARPGGNLTGLLLYEKGIIGKWAAMLKEIAPQLKRAALLANPKTAGAFQVSRQGWCK
jgi:DNA-binding beta-propeller fold protein YncE